MSISSMSEAKLIRQRLDQRDANVVERALGLKRLVERDQPTPEDMVKATGAPVEFELAHLATSGPVDNRAGGLSLRSPSGLAALDPAAPTATLLTAETK